MGGAHLLTDNAAAGQAAEPEDCKRLQGWGSTYFSEERLRRESPFRSPISCQPVNLERKLRRDSHITMTVNSLRSEAMYRKSTRRTQTFIRRTQRGYMLVAICQSLILTGCSREDAELERLQAYSMEQRLACDPDNRNAELGTHGDARCDEAIANAYQSELRLRKMGVHVQRIDAARQLGDAIAARSIERVRPKTDALRDHAALGPTAGGVKQTIVEGSQENKAAVGAPPKRPPGSNQHRIKVECGASGGEVSAAFQALPPPKDLLGLSRPIMISLTQDTPCSATVSASRRTDQTALAVAAPSERELELAASSVVVKLSNSGHKLIGDFVFECEAVYSNDQGEVVYESRPTASRGSDARITVAPGRAAFLRLTTPCSSDGVPFDVNRTTIRLIGFTRFSDQCRSGMAGVTCPGDLLHTGEASKPWDLEWQ